MIHPITIFEKLEALTKKQKYEDCLGILNEFSEELDPSIADKIENEYIEYLLTEKNYEKAIHQILIKKRDDETKWYQWIQRFRQCKKLDLIFYAMVGSNANLGKHYYEFFVYQFLAEEQYEQLEIALRSIYEKIDLPKLTSSLETKAANNISSIAFHKCRLFIAKVTDNAEFAVNLCLQLKDRDVFDILRKHQSISILPIIKKLIDIDLNATVRLISEPGNLKAEDIVSLLKLNEQELFVFLEAAYKIKPDYIADFQQIMVC